VLRAKKNLRLMRVAPGANPLVVKSISGGFLAQTADDAALDRAAAVVKTKRAPSEEEWQALEFAWKVAKAREIERHRLRAAGAGGGRGRGSNEPRGFGQNWRMRAVLSLAGTVVASDAYFPFADGVEEAVAHGATASSTGRVDSRCGSDAAADRLGVAMVFTGGAAFPPLTNSFMREALRLARAGADSGEVPVGAVVAMAARSWAADGTRRWPATTHRARRNPGLARSPRRAWELSLEGATLYSTLEPCAMCAGALVAARVARLVFGARDLRFGGVRAANSGSPIRSCSTIASRWSETCSRWNA